MNFVDDEHDEFDRLITLSVEELTEEVAVAKRDQGVAALIEREAKDKLGLAESEHRRATSKYNMVSHALAIAAEKKHQETHGQPISDLDRELFESRWAAKVAEREAEIAARRAAYHSAKKESTLAI